MPIREVHATSGMGNSMPVILTVDDDPDLLDLLGLALETPGYDVLTATDGPTAIAIAGRHSLDLIITDFHMPGMTGVELAQQIRATPSTRHLPIIVLSAAAGPEHDPDGLIDRWLRKPVSLRQLRAEVCQILDGARASERVPAGGSPRRPAADEPIAQRDLPTH